MTAPLAPVTPEACSDRDAALCATLRNGPLLTLESVFGKALFTSHAKRSSLTRIIHLVHKVHHVQSKVLH